MSDAIPTARLDLGPLPVPFRRACLDGRFEAAAGMLRVSLRDGWFDAASVFELRLRQLEVDPSLAPWLLRAMVRRDTRDMVGYIGFHAAPGAFYLQEWCPSGVELGVSVFASERRKGFAREAAVGLMGWAERTHGVRSFVVSISPDNTASQTLFKSLGFVRVGAHVDDQDGPEDILVRASVTRGGSASPRFRSDA
jgi:RimJ/RimL family protein N-acetyltransferase